VRWIWTGLTSAIVIGAVAFPFLHTPPAPASPADPATAPATSSVVEGRAYYVLLASIEVEPRDADGDRWDVGRAAPDLYYVTSWRDTVVFRSSTKKQTLLARWSNSELGLRDMMGGVSIDDSIKAARVTARPGDVIEFAVFDEDLASDDRVATWSVPVMDLLVGDQAWAAPAKNLVSVVCRVLPVDGVDLGTLTR